MKRALQGALLIAAMTALGIAGRSLWAELADPAAVLRFLRGVSSGAGAIPAFVALCVVGTTLLTPAVVFFIVAGALWGFEAGVPVALLGINLASWVHFGLGRALGRRRVRDFIEKRRMAASLWRELESGGTLAVLLVRQLPLPFIAVNAAAGASPLTFRQFFIGSGVGVIPNAVIYTWFAAAIADGVAGAQEAAFQRGAMAAGAVLALGVASRLFDRWYRRRRASEGEAAPQASGPTTPT